MDMSDEEFNEKKYKHKNCIDNLLNKIYSSFSGADYDEGDALIVATIFLARAIHLVSPFLPFNSVPDKGPAVMLESVDDILESAFEQVKRQLEICRKEEPIH
jgi:hypothetical protein